MTQSGLIACDRQPKHIIHFAKFSFHAVPHVISTNILPLRLLWFKNCSVLMHDVYNMMSDISDLFTPTKDVHHYNTRSSTVGKFYINYSRLNHYKNSFSIMGAKLWNSIPDVKRQLPK